MEHYFGAIPGNFLTRLEGNYLNFKVEDKDFADERNSQGTTGSPIISRPRKIYTVKGGPVAFYQAEKLALALKHDRVWIDGVEMEIVDDLVKIDQVADGANDFNLEFQMAVKVYPYQNSYCTN